MTETKAEKELTPREKAEAELQKAVNAKEDLRAEHSKQIEAARKKRTKELAVANKAITATVTVIGKIAKQDARDASAAAAGQRNLFESPDSQPPLPSAGDVGDK